MRIIRNARSGPTVRNGWRPRVIAVALGAALVLAACGAGGGGPGPGDARAENDLQGARNTRPTGSEEDVRATLSTALRRAGHPAEADVVGREESQLSRLEASFLTDWQIVQVDDTAPPHPVRFHVAVSGTQAYLLTGDPAAFNRMTAADRTEIASSEDAVRLARTFLETTRPARRLTYLIGSVDDIRFRPGLPVAETRRRDQIVAGYRPVVAPPQATATSDGFTVTAYAVQDSDLQRHTLAVAADGHVRDAVDSLVADLPTPYVI